MQYRTNGLAVRCSRPCQIMRNPQLSSGKSTTGLVKQSKARKHATSKVAFIAAHNASLVYDSCPQILYCGVSIAAFDIKVLLRSYIQWSILISWALPSSLLVSE